MEASTSPTRDGRTPPSILILTRNEEANIASCIEACSFSDDVVVLDSYSTDRTVEIARRYAHVRVYQRHFDTEYLQRNFGLKEIAYHHPWVYVCDADERVLPELREEILHEINRTDQEHSAFRLRYKNMFLGQWIRRSSGYPVWIIRLLRPDKVRYEIRATNVHPIVDGSVGTLDEHFEHNSFASGLVRWFNKHNYYSDREAFEALRVRTEGLPKLRQLFVGDPMAKRRAAKNLSFLLPLRGVLRWLHDVILKGGFLDGWAGIRYSTMISMYEYWLEVKIAEAQRRWREGTEWWVRRLLREPGDTRPDPPPVAPKSYPCREDGTPLIDVMIPTLNESAHIEEAVKNALGLGPVYVLDSFSTDGTQEIARKAGATVVEHRFENYSRQKNWGLENLPFRGEWVFILDADERVTPALRDEAIRVAKSETRNSGWFVNRIVVFMGRPIRWGGLYPSWNLRFFRRGACRYEDRSVHEHMICDGETGYMKHLMVHIRRETISGYISKHVRYADMESDEWLRTSLGQGAGAAPARLFRDRLRYRQWVRREVWPRLPGKPVIRWVYMYLLRLGFLDGRAGWHLAALMASYEYMIELLYREKRYFARKLVNQTTSPEQAPGRE
ncbi:MAG: glycosyltransferase [Phycisphaerales bacterium]